VFRAEAKGRPLVLDNAGVVAGNEVFKDRETGSRCLAHPSCDLQHNRHHPPQDAI